MHPGCPTPLAKVIVVGPGHELVPTGSPILMHCACQEERGSEMEEMVNLAEKLRLVDEYFSPRIVGALTTTSSRS